MCGETLLYRKIAKEIGLFEFLQKFQLIPDDEDFEDLNYESAMWALYFFLCYEDND